MDKIYKTSAIGYYIKLARKDQANDIVRFLKEHFNNEETMFKSLVNSNVVINEEEAKLITEDQEKFQKAIFDSSPCLLAFDEKTKKIVGINLMILSQNPRFVNYCKAGTNAVFHENIPKSKLIKDYYHYMSIITDKVDLYDRFPNAKAALEFYAIAVDKNHRKIGLSLDLTITGLSLVKTYSNVGFIFGLYTSTYSKRSAEKIGMKSILDVDLLTYENEKGEPIFQDTPPHNIVSLMVLEL
ncbi:uncharacterized protein LOC122629465 [Vespula pensylvanica]|uniref:Dopamine N-acetyltransferase n=1 Tax=Vespula pensylvanica TaxID=30213 RepID=A0A834P3Q6_VESPE|nr:uncharacterized protein LOC122629465 [Vespula pensylvanica]KAF7427137.1 hypothetical protein H0235_006831 [Vespula pensylvanica]